MKIRGKKRKLPKNAVLLPYLRIMWVKSCSSVTYVEDSKKCSFISKAMDFGFRVQILTSDNISILQIDVA